MVRGPPVVLECERPKTTFTKLEQRSWIKIEVTRGHSAQEYFQGLHEAYADAALPYRTVARWVKAFREGRDVKVMFIVAYDIDGGNTAPCCTSKADGKRGLLEHPPYSPDMIHAITIFSLKDYWNIHRTHRRYDPCDYDLFTKVTEPLRGRRGCTRDTIPEMNLSVSAFRKRTFDVGNSHIFLFLCACADRLSPPPEWWRRGEWGVEDGRSRQSYKKKLDLMRLDLMTVIGPIHRSRKVPSRCSGAHEYG
ncbi:hypothetical protein ANN_13717 [Periplaneta americana]|uniref:Mos1 transposase HTH domain-containing protein n=1 Tax=Periplaneta americana TaxID=6978 RepID=A0ABQ8SVA6_PERAM|nr:hypothetical protein ANN_13717 [Periplaneta americana]